MYCPVNLDKTVLQKQTSVHLRSLATLLGRKRKVQKIFFFFKSRNPKYSTKRAIRLFKPILVFHNCRLNSRHTNEAYLKHTTEITPKSHRFEDIYMFVFFK